MASKPQMKKVPQAPGVYFFLGRGGKILYIGKATNLRTRLQSYFRPSFAKATEGETKQAMLYKVSSFKFKVTSSDVEALILEAQLIKKHRPPYNVLLRDDKTYLSVGFTNEALPRVVFVRRNTEGLETVIGPFTDASALKQTLKLLRRVFPYATHKGFQKHCLFYDLGLCPLPKQAPENSKQLSVLRRDYRRNIKNIQAVLRGEKTGLLKKLEKQMREAARKDDFEKAAKIRDEMSGLKRIFAHRSVVDSRWQIVDRKRLFKNLPPGFKKILPQTWPWRIEGYDISNIQGTSATGSLIVFRGTQPDKSQYRKFKIKTVRGANDVAMIREVLARRLQHSEPFDPAQGASKDAWPMPDIVLIDGGKPQLNAAHAVVSRWQIVDGEKLPIVLGLAKKHEEIYMQGKKQPFRLPKNNPFLLLLMHVRDEAHRFARNYHHTLRRIR